MLYNTTLSHPSSNSYMALCPFLHWNRSSRNPKKSRIIDVDTNECKCILRKTYELPYAQELAEYARVNMPISLNCIEGYWRKLDMSQTVSIDCEVVDDLNNHCTEEYHMINQRFFVANNSKKNYVVKEIMIVG